MNRELCEQLIDHWGNNGVAVIMECQQIKPFNDTFDKFLSKCMTCGGDWGAMLLTGLKDIYPKVWDAIPNKMGKYAFIDICAVLELCGVKMPAEEINK